MSELLIPHRVQLSRQKGWRKPDNTVVVARPSKWGNPFRVISSGHGGTVIGPTWSELDSAPFGAYREFSGDAAYASCSHRAVAVESAVDLFRVYCKVKSRRDPDGFAAWIQPLAGKNLACWCRSDGPCHAHPLLELANGGDLR